jgi:Transposase, Mutator family
MAGRCTDQPERRHARYEAPATGWMWWCALAICASVSIGPGRRSGTSCGTRHRSRSQNGTCRISREVYLALLRASQHDLRAELAATVAAHGGLILAVDGLQPEQGNEQLWVVREVFSGKIVVAANLQQASAPVLEPFLQPIAATRLPILGVISDAQQSLRLAVAAVFPRVPHQLCQYHALREAAEPLWEADRHLLVEAKKELRELRDVEERTRRQEPPDAASGVILDTVLALRQTVRERGTLPFDFAGLGAMAALTELGQTLDRCLEKRGTRDWPASARS